MPRVKKRSTAPASWYRAFSANLRRLRAESGLTQVQLAEAIGMTAGAIGHIEAGDTRAIPAHRLRATVDALGCTLEELLP